MEENQYKGMNFIERLQYFMEKKGINDNQMTVNAGLSVGLIGKAKVSGKGMSSMNIEKILLAYPELSADWLLTGAGSMLKPNSNSIQTELEPEDTRGETAIPVPEGCHKGIPLVPLSAMAGAFTDETSVMEYECERYVIPAFKGADFLIQIKGDSMQPTYYSGDLVACQRMPLNDIFFQWNKAYVLDTVQGPLIKRIMPGSDADHVLVVSDNSNYPSFELHKAQFNGVALVRGLVRLE
ncbi:MAG TPA: S24 family peptidase [Alloprevotella sp.]|nr:S24 family peptidase [Alloprevotella sp.]